MNKVYIFLFSFSDTKNFQCKSYNPDSLKGSLQNVDWKFQEKPTTWLQLECHCDFEQTFVITDTRGSSTLKKYFQVCKKIPNVLKKQIFISNSFLFFLY